MLFATLPQRRYLDGKHVEPVKEIQICFALTGLFFCVLTLFFGVSAFCHIYAGTDVIYSEVCLFWQLKG